MLMCFRRFKRYSQLPGECFCEVVLWNSRHGRHVVRHPFVRKQRWGVLASSIFGTLWHARTRAVGHIGFHVWYIAHLSQKCGCYLFFQAVSCCGMNFSTEISSNLLYYLFAFCIQSSLDHPFKPNSVDSVTPARLAFKLSSMKPRFPFRLPIAAAVYRHYHTCKGQHHYQ
jgi:hypothetical protein